MTLRDRVETLAQTHRHNPRTVGLLVESAKRYVVNSDFRVRLDELLKSECHTLLKQLDSSGLSPPLSFNGEAVRKQDRTV